MNYLKLFMFSLAALLFLTACGENTSTEVDPSVGDQDNEVNSEGNGKVEAELDEVLSPQEFSQMLSNPGNFKGSYVDYIGRVFIVEHDADGTYLQIWADPEKNDHNTIVGIPDPNFEVSDGDYIHITGMVKDEFKGENAFGAELIVPLIEANKYEITDYINAISPTRYEVLVDQEQEQSGYTVLIDKIEFGEKDTRVYVTIKNDSDSSISFWSHSAKLVQDGKQYDTEYNWDSDYPELQSDIRPGVSSEGILSFPVTEFEDHNELTLYLDGSSDDWEINIDEFQFHITW
ncbi:DUF4352 domain-containing protein [Bacillus sp. FJAT-45350]|uniref:DUF4352 domain-containing protein n=1 Tax=Bacillus sp. FJAT-45350 TaxID=2011014 RepID=UPI0015CCC8EB|nr:DUF4352 domain-containing protein [Bacillus sp. FJAT-45350]